MKENRHVGLLDYTLLTAPISGGDNKLAVGLVAYEPKVRCDGRRVRIDTAACTSIKYAMHASNDQKRFGDPLLDPGVQVRLPYSMVGGTLFYLQFHHLNPIVRIARDTY